MNKTELIAAVAEKASLSKKDTESVVMALIETIKDTLNSGDKVQIVGFGTFEAKQRAARKGLNPMTKQPIDIPACTVPAFKAGKAFKDAIK